MKNKYYYLILPNKKVNFEAIDEVCREQEAYDKEYGVGGIPKILRPEY